MKKRIIAGVLILFMLLPVLAVPVLAAAGFPYSEFEKEGNNYRITVNSDYDTERGEIIYPQGYMYKGTYTYKGYRNNISQYTQKAKVTVRTPQGFMDPLATGTDKKWTYTVFYSPDQLTNHSEDSYKEDVGVNGDSYRNSVSYAVEHTNYAYAGHVTNNKKIEDVIQEKIDLHSNEEEGWKVEVVSGNGYRAVIRKKETSTNEPYQLGSYQRETYELECYIYYIPSELKGAYIEIEYTQTDAVSAYIGAPDHGDYQTYLNKYKKIYSDHKEKDFMSKLLNVRSLVTITWEKAEVSDDYDGPIGSGTSQAAQENPGEDAGVTVPLAIVIGVVAAAAAIGAVAAASGTGEKRTSSYKMYVQKDFGDAMNKGAKTPSVIRARMAEIDPSGVERERIDLTKKITASADGMTIHSTAFVGKYLEARVSIPKDSEKHSASITFTFTGEGGYFRNTVVFRIVGDPWIAFPRDTEEGKWDLNYPENEVDLIKGLGGRERLRFTIIDAVEEPVEIRFSESEGLVITSEKDTGLSYTYYAVIENNTPLMKKESDIFAEEEKRKITVWTKFSDGQEIAGVFTANLWPDGLSVPRPKDKNSRGYVKDGRLEVETLPQAMGGDWNGAVSIPATPFNVCVAFLNSEGHPVIRKNPSIKHNEKLIEEEEYGKIFSENFNYSIDHGGSVSIDICPAQTLPALGDPYKVKMEFSCSIDGKDFEGILPLALFGENPEPPSAAEHRKAVEWLKRDIKTFGIGNDPQVMAIVRNADSMSATQIGYARKGIIEAGVIFYRQHGAAYQQYGELMTKYIVVAGTLVQAGDYAFEKIMLYYFGGYGQLAAKFINPLKNLLGTYIGELFANGNLDEAPDFIQTVLTGTEEALSAAITGVFFKSSDLLAGTGANYRLGSKTLRLSGVAYDEVKDILGYVIAVYLLTCFVRHYHYGEKGEKGDVYRSVLAAITDLGYESLKAWFVDYIGKYCKAMFEKLCEAAGKLFQSLLKSHISKLATEAGSKAFQDSLRGSYKINLDGLTKGSLEAARTARDAASKGVEDLWNGAIQDGSKVVGDVGGKILEWGADSKIVGVILNYKVNGTVEDNESLGLEAKEVVFNYVTDRLGVELDKIYEAAGDQYYYDVTVSIEDGKIILGLLGFCVEINFFKNITAISERMFDTLLEWLDDIFAKLKKTIGFDGPDPRDKQEKNVNVIEENLEKRKKEMAEFEWQYARYMQKTKSGMKTII